MKLVITGGHHSSALPVINELKRRNPDIELYWIGHRHSLKGDKNDTLEYKEITALSIPFYELNTGKFYKTYNPFKVLKVINGLFQSYKILSKIKPDLIMSFGGYLAVPVVIVGYLLKIPAITHEQTMVTGYANKVISRFAKKILLSWESSKKYYPGKSTVVTGIPLRSSIFNVSSNIFETQNNLPTILIMGGKSGSHITK
jgi:UDP-N-acetylglucosamine--N-acetylmuramyl-(pentapeptide) pyrophosphoryl-undecaprenol N-acetylglucosamine transferase